ncbi:r2 protein [Lasius niger]|uniref:R2 protein n=1 Tax=Lasius niger TaxID=67767 RepID=A0A0J7LBJ9_LASNI|nr:r2 protein [Lasius niger]
METIVKLAVLRSGIKLGNSEDQILKKAIGELETRYRKYATSLGIAWPATRRGGGSEEEEQKTRDGKMETASMPRSKSKRLQKGQTSDRKCLAI